MWPVHVIGDGLQRVRHQEFIVFPFLVVKFTTVGEEGSVFRYFDPSSDPVDESQLHETFFGPGRIRQRYTNLADDLRLLVLSQEVKKLKVVDVATTVSVH